MDYLEQTGSSSIEHPGFVQRPPATKVAPRQQYLKACAFEHFGRCDGHFRFEKIGEGVGEQQHFPVRTFAAALCGTFLPSVVSGWGLALGGDWLPSRQVRFCSATALRKPVSKRLWREARELALSVNAEETSHQDATNSPLQ